MQLSKLAIDKITASLDLRLKIALALGIGEAGVKAAIKRNSSSLTKYACIQVIKTETGLTDEQIIQSESANA